MRGNVAKLSNVKLLIPKEASANDGTDGHEGSMTRSKRQFDNWAGSPGDRNQHVWQQIIYWRQFCAIYSLKQSEMKKSCSIKLIL